MLATHRTTTVGRPSVIQRAVRPCTLNPCLKVWCLDGEWYSGRDERVGCPVLRKGEGSRTEELEQRRRVKQHPEKGERGMDGLWVHASGQIKWEDR